MTDLVLLRHGRTAWNAVRRIQGHAESQLDALGHAQAAAVAPSLAALSPTLLWSSDSERARETASYVSAATGLTPTYDARLREFSLGVREGLHHHEYEASAPEEYAEFVRGNYDVVEGGERGPAVRARMTAALLDLAAALPPDGVGVAVSHGSSSRAAVAALLGWPETAEPPLRGMDNCGWTVLRRTSSERPWRLVAYNRLTAVAHPPD